MSGANEAGYHFINTNYGRDYTAQIVADIAAANDGDGCINCGTALHSSRGVEVGNIFKLGTKYSQAMGATVLGEDGVPRPIVMGSYGIGVGRLLACIAEAHHDEFGLRWPAAVAPYQVHLVALGGKDVAVNTAAEAAYQALQSTGVEVLFDDRVESPGVKFTNADLIGLPLRITISGKSLAAGGAEVKRRDSATREIVPLDQLTTYCKS